MRNSITLLGRNGEVVAIYDKNHPTIGEIENGILPGTEAVVAECDFGRVGFAICFDLNFPELRAKYVPKKPDLMVFCSMYHGGLVQAYWAYDCRSYFVGAICRRCPSEIRDPHGRVIASTTNYFDYAIATVNLDFCLAHLDYNWGRLARLRKKYGPKVTVSDPGLWGFVSITSWVPDRSAEDLAREFEIELLDDYFNRARKVRAANLPKPERPGE